MKPALLSKGSPDEDEKRQFHIRVGKKAVSRTIGGLRNRVRPILCFGLEATDDSAKWEK